MHVVEYDGKALSNFKQSRTSPNKATSVSANNPASYDRHVSQAQLSIPVVVNLKRMHE